MSFYDQATHLAPIDELLADLDVLGFKYLPTTVGLLRDQAAMLAAFQRRQVNPRLWRPMEHCKTGRCERRPCSAACHLGERLDILRWISEAANIFSEDGLPCWWLTVAYARYRTAVGELPQFEPGPMLQSLRRSFRRLEAETGPVRAFGAIEAAHSVELDGSERWDPHPHVLLAGPGLDENVIHRHFEPSGPKLVGHKPVVVKPAYDTIGAMTYATMRDPMQRFAYIDKNGRQARNEHGVSPARRAEYDRWLLSQRRGERLVLHGFKRVHGHLVRLR